MVNYRRARVPPAAYFFTVTLRDRRKSYLIAHVDLLRSVVRGVRHERPFTIEAAVILPIIFMRFGLCPQATPIVRVVGARSRRASAGHSPVLVPHRRGEYELWQRRFWEHLIHDDSDFARHVDYIHYNPVKHGLVADPVDWRWSSIHAFARRGIVGRGWRGCDQDGTFGD